MFLNEFLPVILPIILVQVSCAPATIVQTKNGPVEGELRGNYVAFEGIPYAEPPLGENRFEATKPLVQQWTELRPAKTIGAKCLQYDLFPQSDEKIVGSEDCLFVNVYKPVTARDDPLPVILHIHGGGFMFGDGSFYGPEHLMKFGKFVYVSFNYRLGIFGFLSTKSDAIPGNMGMKDQVQALKWVQDNIEAFGGDKHNVTLTGFSAGGTAVHLHYLSPLSKGLFHRGISHSGDALTMFVLTEKADGKFNALAAKLQCSNDNLSQVVDCLKTKSAREITALTPTFGETIGGTYIHPTVSFGLVVEEDHDGAFLTKTPAEYMKAGHVQKLPWLVSAVQLEGVFMVAELYKRPEALQSVDEMWTHVAPLVLDYNTTDEAIKERVSIELKSHFFKGEPISKQNFGKLAQMISDRYFLYSITQSIELQRHFAPVYFYFFEYKQRFGFGEALGQTMDNLGVAHGEDIILIYSTPLHGDRYNYTVEETTMSEKLLEMYESFIQNDVPRFDNVELTRTVDKLEYTRILNVDSIVTGATKPLCDAKFWENIYQDLNDD